VPEDISNVNLFRLVLDEYYNAGLTLLENRQYFNKDMQVHYRLQDVSARVDETCKLPAE